MNDNLLKKISETDQIKLENYLRLYDRLVLYSLVAQILTPESVDETFKIWEKSCKKHIDTVTNDRTSFLESTPTGRLAKILKEPDGETYRLDCISTLNVAKELIKLSIDNARRDSDDEQSYS